MWQARRSAATAGHEIEEASAIRFQVRKLGAALPENIGTFPAAAFSDAALFHGRLYLAAATSLLEYETDGTSGRQFCAGLELPGAGIEHLTVGTLPDSAAQELLIGTAGEGLVAFDGTRFRQIRPEDAAYAGITAMLPLPTGRLLLGTAKAGVLVYDGKRLSAFHESLAALHVTVLAGDDTELWVGTQDRGVVHWHAGAVGGWGEAEGLPDRHVLSLAVTADAVYAGTPLGIAVFRGGRLERTVARGVFATALLPGTAQLAIGTFDEGVLAAPLSSRPARPARMGRGGFAGTVRKLFEAGGTSYALTENALYEAAEGGTWRPLVKREGNMLADPDVSALAVDPTGRLWVGYFDRGLDIVNGGRISHVENDTVFCVNRIVCDPASQTTAVATANGLALFDAAGHQQQNLSRAQGLIADHVADVLYSAGRTVAATPAGLSFFDSAGTHSVSGLHGLVNQHVYALAEDGDMLLAGTLGGLSVLEHGAVRASYTTANSGLKHNWITAVARVGADWFVGTYGAGVMRFTGSAWERFPDLKPDLIVNPNALLTTAGHVYAGTLSHGLMVYDRSTRRWRRASAGLPSANVTALAAAGGVLWVGTENGMVRIPENSIQ